MSTDPTSDSLSRRVVANISLSLDGRICGRDGEYDMGWIAPHAVTDAARDHMVTVTSAASTALMGRKNAQGFGGFWPGVADDAQADERDRTFSRWLTAVEKVVFSTTTTDVGWPDAKVVDGDPATVVADLRTQPGTDIIVLSSTSIIQALLDADEVDRLGITLCPEVVGGGRRLFEDDKAARGWSLVSCTSSDSGALSLLYDRRR